MKIVSIYEEQYMWSSDLLVEGLCEGYELNSHCMFYFKKDDGVWRVSARYFEGAIEEPIYLCSDFDAFAANICMKVLQLIRRERGTEHLCVYDELDYFQDTQFSEEYQQLEAGINFNLHEFLRSYAELAKVTNVNKSLH